MFDWVSSGLVESTVSEFLWQTEENHVNSLSRLSVAWPQLENRFVPMVGMLVLCMLSLSYPGV